MSLKPGFPILVLVLCLYVNTAQGQACTTLGQTPSTAFPVCGTSSFEQDNVPICSSSSLFVPGCGTGANYSNKNPFWYKFTCYVAGKLSFVITPKDLTDDYDWQLYDVTGLDPNQVLTNQNIIVTGNWSGSSGLTGASSTGVTFVQCASNPATENAPTFARSPDLKAGHEYILLVSHYTDSQSGYSLSFAGGTAVITDPKEPHLETASPGCDGKQITLKLNKKMKCNSLTTQGTEFSILPAVTTVTGAVAINCNSGFDFDEIVITLADPLPGGNYQLRINEGADDNTVVDNCGRGIPINEQVAFSYAAPQPIPIDSVAGPGCAPQEVKLHFSKKIDCSTIAANGSNFLVTGPTPVTVIGATGDCNGGLSETITVRFNAPIYTKGLYTVTPKLSVNGGAVVDECGQVIQPLPVNFQCADTVSAAFTFANDLGCRFDTLHFAHDGAHDVNEWRWVFNTNVTAATRLHTIAFSASSTNAVELSVSNGTCSATSTASIILNNEVKAGFDMPDDMCPEDRLVLTNTSTGLIDTWRWNYTIGTSQLETPGPLLFPSNNIETKYPVKLVATNNAIGCSDSLVKTLRVLNNCFIAVPSAFTPNGDGLNDFLHPNNALKAQNLEFKVFNRWGQLVFETRNWQQKWNGKIGGIPQTAGVYVWFLRYTHLDTGKSVFQKGTTTLIR